MDFIAVAFLLSGFLLITSILFFQFRQQFPSNGHAWSFRNILGLLAVLYLAVAHLGALTASGEALFLVNQAPCENIVANTTTVSNITSYEFVDSCADRILPRSAEILHIIFLNLIYFELILAFIGLLLGVAWVFKQW